MKIAKVQSAQDLKTIIENGTQIGKKSVSLFIENCFKYLNENETVKLLNNIRYDGSFKVVIRELVHQKRTKIINELLDLELNETKRLSRLIIFDNFFPDKSRYIISKIFNDKIDGDMVFYFIFNADITSDLYRESLKKIRQIDLKAESILRGLYNISKILEYPTSNIVRLADESFFIINSKLYNESKLNLKDAEWLIELRIYLIKSFLKSNYLNSIFNLIFIDLLVREDLVYLDKQSYLHDWLLFELEIKKIILEYKKWDYDYLFSELFECDGIQTDDDILIKILNSTRSLDVFLEVYDIIRSRIHLHKDTLLPDEDIYFIDYKALLSNKLSAYYLNGMKEILLRSRPGDYFGHSFKEYVKRNNYLPALRNIPEMSSSFKWPTIYDVKKYIWKGDMPLNDNSPLTRLDYHVGKKSNITMRRERLDFIFKYASENEIEDDTWGRPGSARRLEKMARHIAWSANRSTSIKAINDWKDDLEYLRQKYYLNHKVMDFEWPRI